MQNPPITIKKVPKSPLKTLPEAYGPKTVQKATRQLFNQIKKAAINRDSIKLYKIRDSFILSDNEMCFSVVWHGFTPLTKLINEGDLESAAFLYNRHRQEIMKTEVTLVISKELQKKLFNTPIKRYKPETIQDHIHCIEILMPHLTQINEVAKRVNLDVDFLSACASVLSGDDDKVREFLTSDWLLTYSNPAAYKGCIAYLYGKYRPNNVLKELWPGDDDTRQWLLKGFFAGGHFNQNAQFINKKTHMPNELVFATMQQMLANRQYMLATLYHPTILRSLLACIDREDFREAMANFLDLFQIEFTHDTREKSKIYKILKNASALNHCMRTYHLNYEQSLLFLQQHIYTWLTQGIQVIPNKDSLIKIASLLTDSSVSEKTLQKTYFDTQQQFLIKDLNRYLSDVYKANRYHANRARSFKDACLQADSIISLKNLINSQLGLFNRSEQGNGKSKTKHETPYGKKGRDEFIDLLEKYQLRLR